MWLKHEKSWRTFLEDSLLLSEGNMSLGVFDLSRNSDPKRTVASSTLAGTVTVPNAGGGGSH